MDYTRGRLAYFTAGVAAAVTFTMVYKQLSKPPRSRANIHRSPIDTVLPSLPPAAHKGLPYPPNLIPGARDVYTPYGTMRVYEWGPEDGQKVLLIHGISGACLALLGCAEELANKGCRVMMIELFGRGWSGGPSDLPYDGRLYCTQILLALQSSPIAWTGRQAGRFKLIGYSLGGCISVDFTSWFPHLVDDLVLIAPAGLIRNGDWKTWLIYSGWLPEAICEKLVERRLLKSPNIVKKPQKPTNHPIPEESAAGAAISHRRSLSQQARELDAEKVVRWQIAHNEGFLFAFIESIRHGPTRHQHARWQMIGRRCDLLRQIRASAVEDEAGEIAQNGLRVGRVLICVGARDQLIKTSEIVPDATAALGETNVKFETFPNNGHEVGMARGPEIAECAWRFWNEAEPRPKSKSKHSKRDSGIGM